MNAAETNEVLAAARDALRKDPAGAIKLYSEIIERGSGMGWAHAHLDVAEHEFGLGRTEASTTHTRAILDAPEDRVDSLSRAVAGILWCEARDLLELEIDEPLLLQSIEVTLAQGQKKWAALGLMNVAARQIGRGERSAGKATILRAVELYEAADAIAPVALALRYLARLEIEDGNRESAERHIDRGMSYLKKFPFDGSLARVWETRLGEFRDKIPRE
jgi:tetratricopeptide (TPR) repeat protein